MLTGLAILSKDAHIVVKKAFKKGGIASILGYFVENVDELAKEKKRIFEFAGQWGVYLVVNDSIFFAAGEEETSMLSIYYLLYRIVEIIGNVVSEIKIARIREKAISIELVFIHIHRDFRSVH